MATTPLLRLRKGRASDGFPLPGLWESDALRLEKEDDRWVAYTTLREIGRTGYFEFTPQTHGAHWLNIGRYRTRADAIRYVEALMTGNYVWKPAHTLHTEDGSFRVPGQRYPWAEVSAEIAAHPSVRGDA